MIFLIVRRMATVPLVTLTFTLLLDLLWLTPDTIVLTTQDIDCSKMGLTPVI